MHKYKDKDKRLKPLSDGEKLLDTIKRKELIQRHIYTLSGWSDCTVCGGRIYKGSTVFSTYAGSICKNCAELISDCFKDKKHYNTEIRFRIRR